MALFDLEKEVHPACVRGDVTPGGRHDLTTLIGYFRTFENVVRFTAELLLELRPGNWLGSPHYNGVDYDAYGIAASEQLQLKYGVLGLETWYVKFTMDESSGVVVASLHEPKKTLACAGGPIRVRFSQRDPE